jgi:hypothetical protein
MKTPNFHLLLATLHKPGFALPIPSSLIWMLALLLSMMAAPLDVAAQQNADLGNVSRSIQKGDAKALSRYFDSSVEITIVDKEGTYSKSQAEVVVKTFFDQHSPQSFKVVHQGSSGGNSKYVIGKLETSQGRYRTYLYVKLKDGSPMIQQLRFEEE